MSGSHKFVGAGAEVVLHVPRLGIGCGRQACFQVFRLTLFLFQSFQDYLCESSLHPLDSKTEVGYATKS